MPRLCIHKGCKTYSSFGVKWGVPYHCFEHKEKNEIYVNGKQCQVDGCSKNAIHGSPIDRIRLRCYLHKIEGDINVSRKKCRVADCLQNAKYGCKKLNMKNHCDLHKIEGEVNLTNKVCEFEGCEIHATFGTIQSNPIHCLKHKTEDEVVVHTKKKDSDSEDNNSEESDSDEIKDIVLPPPSKIQKTLSNSCHKCSLRATFGVPSEYPIACARHRDLTKHIMNPQKASIGDTAKCAWCYRDIHVDILLCGHCMHYQIRRKKALKTF